MPERVQLRRTKGWRKPPGAVVVARPSRWGNPYPIARYRAEHPDGDERVWRRMAVSDFRDLVEGRRPSEDSPSYPSIEVVREHLAGQDLACWCPLDQPCHADVLLELANGRSSS